MNWVTGIAMMLAAQETDDLREQIRRMQETIQAQQRMLEALQERIDDVESREAPAGYAPAQEDQPAEPPPYSSGFLRRFSGAPAYLGGYIDLEYFNRDHRELGRATRDPDPTSTFDQHRLVLLASADVSDRIRFYSEIEIEHGEELGVEFAHIDLHAHDWLNFRAGIILLPFRFNLFHDSPMNELTARPAMAEFLVPSVMRDPGLGVFGRIDLTDGGAYLDYEFYVTNGFKGLGEETTDAIRITRAAGLRNARPHVDAFGSGAYRDFNDNKALTGRLTWVPTLGLEIGGSAHYGDYDERGNNALGLYAFDVALEGGTLYNAFSSNPEGESWFRDFLYASRFVTEIAYADIERDAFAHRRGIPGDMSGWYVEYNYRFFPDFVRDLMGPLATEDSTLTLTARYDDLRISRRHQEMLTVGLNFRPIPNTVLKFDYQIDINDADEGFLFSIATYF